MSAYMYRGDTTTKTADTKKPKSGSNKKPKPLKSILTKEERRVYLMLIALIVISLGVLIYKYSEVYGITAEIQQVQREINTLTVHKDVLNSQVESLQGPDRIKAEAEKMGMLMADFDEDLIVVEPGKAKKP